MAHAGTPTCRTMPCHSEWVCHQLELRIFGEGLDAETQPPHQLEHGLIVRQHQPVNLAEALFTGDVHDAFHQPGAQPLAIEIIGHNQRELAARLIRIGDVTRDTHNALSLADLALTVGRAFLESHRLPWRLNS